MNCGNCGADRGLHHYKTMQCPKNGIEEMREGYKQVWIDSVFKDDSSEQKIIQLQEEINELKSRQECKSGEPASELFAELFILSYKYMNHPHDTGYFKELNSFFTKHSKFCEKCKGSRMLNEPNKPEKHDCAFCDGLGFTISLPTQSGRPTDDEIKTYAKECYGKHLGYTEAMETAMVNGAKWMRDNYCTQSGLNKEEIIKWIDEQIKGRKEQIAYHGGRGNSYIEQTIDDLNFVKKHILSFPPNSETIWMPKAGWNDEEGVKINTKSITDNLLPCPFCGGEPEWIGILHPDSRFRLRCFNCRYFLIDDRRDKVISLWNSRSKSVAGGGGERI